MPVRKYHYENPLSPYLLTGISVWNSQQTAWVRYSTYTYDTNLRVSRSELAGGEEADNFSYETNSTTVSDAYDQSTVYNFEPISLSGPGTC